MNIANKVKIIYEESCNDMLWHKQLLGGLTKELKKRRITYEQTSAFEDISQNDIVCIIGMNQTWIESVIETSNKFDCIPIVLINQSKCNAHGKYHLVYSDMWSATLKLKEKLATTGRKKIALYSASYSSDLDRDFTEIFSALIDYPSDTYINTGNLEACFRSFYPKASIYDAVICANGYAAVSLVKRLEQENPELLDKLVILSCEEKLRSSKYNQWISMIDQNLETYGPTAYTIIEMILAKSNISNIKISMGVDLCKIPPKPLESFDTPNISAIDFEDPEIVNMGKIDQLLQDADDLDHHIFAMLLCNATYTEIADSCYMSERNIKYRVKKYMSICDCTTKRQLLELLKEYLQ